MKKWLLAVGCIMLPWAGHAQVSNPQIVSVASAPSGACSVTLPLQLKTPDGTLYSCQSGTWGQVGGGGGATLAGDVTGPANNNVASKSNGYPIGMVRLQQIVVSGTTSTSVPITIPPGYTDVELRITNAAVSDAAVNEQINCAFNGDATAGDYASSYLVGGSSIPSAGAYTSATTGAGCAGLPGSTAFANSSSQATITIADYLGATRSTSFSTIGWEPTATTFGGITNLIVHGQWKGTSGTPTAVTSMTVTDSGGGHFMDGTIFTLYGIK